jgi:hypothetical protein
MLLLWSDTTRDLWSLTVSIRRASSDGDTSWTSDCFVVRSERCLLYNESEVWSRKPSLCMECIEGIECRVVDSFETLVPSVATTGSIFGVWVWFEHPRPWLCLYLVDGRRTHIPQLTPFCARGSLRREPITTAYHRLQCRFRVYHLLS